MMKQIKNKVFLILFSMIVVFCWADDTTSFQFNKKYESARDSFSVILTENAMKKNVPAWNKEGGLNTEIYDADFCSDDFFDYIEIPNTMYMVFSCEINDISFMTLLKDAQNIKQYVSSFTNHLSYTDNKNIGANYLAFVTKVEPISYVIETINNKKVHFMPKYSWGFSSNPWAINNKSAEKKVSFICSDNDGDQSNKQMKVDSLVISNGFVMPSKPYLYEQNCRAKTIKLTMNGKSVIHVLEDTSNYQIVKLPESFSPSPDVKVELEIIDWYQGTKYDDIVIAAVAIPVIRLKD